MRPILSIDTETTHRIPGLARVLELGAVLILDNGEIFEFSSLVKPKHFDPRECREALMINKIPVDEILRAPSEEEVSRKFWEWIEYLEQVILPMHNISIKHQSWDWIGFNVRNYDGKILTEFPWNFPYHWDHDVMYLAQEVMGQAGVLPQWPDGSYKWPRLEEAKSFFGIPGNGSHRAVADAKATLSIFLELQRRKAI